MIVLREEVVLDDFDGVRTWLLKAHLSGADLKELEIQRSSPTQSRDTEFLDCLLA